MGPWRRLPDGRAQLRGRALATGQADGARPAASPPRQIAPANLAKALRRGPDRGGFFAGAALREIVADLLPIVVDIFSRNFTAKADTFVLSRG